jgi:WD40 repeat protein
MNVGLNINISIIMQSIFNLVFMKYIYIFLNLVYKTLSNDSDDVHSLAILSRDSIASGSKDSSIRIWNITDGSLIKTLNGHTDQISCLVVLENGYLVSSSKGI